MCTVSMILYIIRPPYHFSHRAQNNHLVGIRAFRLAILTRSSFVGNIDSTSVINLVELISNPS
jgi:hypothetical protein